MTLDIDPDGNVRSIKGNDKAQAAGAAAGQFTTVSGIQMLMSPMTSVTKSKGEAKIGEQWTTADIMDAGIGKVKIQTLYTLAGLRGGNAEIPIKGTITLDSEAAGLPGADAGPIKLKDSKYTGKLLWNTKDGMVESLDLEQSLSLEMGTAGANAQFVQQTKTKISRVGR
jgi:hypothetical protein